MKRNSSGWIGCYAGRLFADYSAHLRCHNVHPSFLACGNCWNRSDFLPPFRLLLVCKISVSNVLLKCPRGCLLKGSVDITRHCVIFLPDILCKVSNIWLHAPRNDAHHALFAITILWIVVCTAQIKAAAITEVPEPERDSLSFHCTHDPEPVIF